MASFKLDKFGGQLPGWDAHLLPEGQAQDCTNAYLFSGALNGWRVPKLLRPLDNPNARVAWRVPADNKAAAFAFLAFKANPTEGDIVKVGEVPYIFRNTLAGQNTIQIGTSAASSAANLFAAMGIGQDPALDLTRVDINWGKGTENNPAVSMATTGDHVNGADGGGIFGVPILWVYAPDYGLAYNTTPVSAISWNDNLVWLYELNYSSTTTTLRGGVNPAFDNSILGAAYWLEFEDHETDVVRAPVVDDKYRRVYIASPTLQPRYNTYDRIAAALPPWLLGIPPPGDPPTVTVSGGLDVAQLGFPNALTPEMDTPGSNMLFLIPVTAPSTQLAVTIGIAAGQDLGTVNIRFTGVIYDDNAGVPGKLLATSAEEIAGLNDLNNFITIPFANPITLKTATKYWIGFITDGPANINAGTDPNGGTPSTTGVKGATTYSNGPPATAPTMTTGQASWQIWAGLEVSPSNLETRAYAYTWLTEYDEESAPSPPTVVTGEATGEWVIGMFQPPPDMQGGNRNITKKRLYRTISAISGQTDYFLVTPPVEVGAAPALHAGDMPVTQASYTDTVLDDVISYNTILPSANWFPPPEGLMGLRAMPNGMMVGFKGNELWFCEPYRPHAWPPGYVLTTEFPIVGIGVTGQSVVACTSAMPYIATGIRPSSMTLTKVLIPEPCNSRGSIVSTLGGVYYTSPNGLILVSGFGVGTNVTETWITREKWRELTPPVDTHAIALASCYVAFGTVRPSGAGVYIDANGNMVSGGDVTYSKVGFTLPLADDSTSFTIWPQPGRHRLGFNRMTAPNDYDIFNVFTDPWTGIGLLIQNGGIYYYDFDDLAPTIMPYKWKTKIYQQTSKKNYEAMKIWFTVPSGTPALNATRNETATDDSSWLSLGSDRYGIVRVYGDGNLVTTREIRKSGELLRIMSGFKYEMWEWEFEGRVLISNMQAGTSARELGGV